MKLSPEAFSQTLVTWYEANKRDLPWRQTKDPYKIWLSEIILQQTRVKQGMPYYEKFVEAYPTVVDLAQAPEQEVLRLWQGLGYYSRARNLHAAAQMVANEYEGSFPDNYKELLKLKGVGEYTAAAIASFAFQEKVAVVDGNVFRVLARLFNLDDDIASNPAKKKFTALANQLISPTQPDAHNQAMMEFGALHCTPQKPNCLFCPFQQACLAFQFGKQQELPVKIKKVKIKKRYFQYIVWQYQDQILAKERPAGDIWQGLHDFHLVETKKATTTWEATLDELSDDFILEKTKLAAQSEEKKHVLSHQHIFARFFKVEVSDSEVFHHLQQQYGLQSYTSQMLEDAPKPILIGNYLKDSFEE